MGGGKYIMPPNQIIGGAMASLAPLSRPHAGMSAFKGINTESDWPQLALQQCVCPAENWRHTLTTSHLVDDDIDTCTMEEARNLNFCRTDGDGASELQHNTV